MHLAAADRLDPFDRKRNKLAIFFKLPFWVAFKTSNALFHKARIFSNFSINFRKPTISKTAFDCGIFASSL